MGNDYSLRLTSGEMEELTKLTAFSTSEIRQWSKKFHECSPSGKMTKSEFQRMYDNMADAGKSKLLVDHVFRAYDADSNGYIDFREFLCSLSVTSRGTIDDKLRWAFALYDLDGNGFVTRKEVHDIFTAIFKMRGGNMGIPRCNIRPKEAVDKMFKDLDKDGDQRLSDIEFIIGAKSSPIILSLLESTADSEKVLT